MHYAAVTWTPLPRPTDRAPTAAGGASVVYDADTMKQASSDPSRMHGALRTGGILMPASDTLSVLLGYALAIALYFQLGGWAEFSWPWAALVTVTAAAVTLATGLALKVYHGRSPVSSASETVSLSIQTAASVVVVALVCLIGNEFSWALVPLAGGLIALALMCAARAWWRVLDSRRGYQSSGARRRTVVVGAGNAGQQVVESMRTSAASELEPVALVDDDPRKRHLRVSGVGVAGTLADLGDVVREFEADLVVLAIPSGSPELYDSVAERAREAGADIKILPSISELFSDIVGIRDLRDINLTDVLGRRQVETDLDSISHYLAGKRVLITGAGGSIGSELARQVSRWQPAELMLLDRDESALHGVELSLHGHGLLDTDQTILADIRDGDTLLELFAERRPEVVFHAAALKHLPMLEKYPHEGYKTNVLGTLNVLRAAAAADVERFVNISTDKAADPTSVLGLTKRVAERLTASYAASNDGRYISVRFGNVLGSRGSVLAAWAAQIARGGPLTVTDPEVTRYFMTIHEACQLVLQAGAEGSSGEVLILDMGQPVKMVDVARKVIAQSGSQVEIVFTGLRPGEKLHETLLSGGELGGRPLHDLITHAPVPALSESAVTSGVSTDMRAALQSWCSVDVGH